MEVRGPSTGLDELISQVLELDELAKQVQIDDVAAGEITVRELATRYEVWYVQPRMKFFGGWTKPPSQYRGRLSYWQNPYQSSFQQPVAEQKRILLQAQARSNRKPELAIRDEAAIDVPDAQPDNKVFVIHGRDKKARREFYTFLRAIGLDPIE